MSEGQKQFSVTSDGTNGVLEWYVMRDVGGGMRRVKAGPFEEEDEAVRACAEMNGDRDLIADMERAVDAKQAGIDAQIAANRERRRDRAASATPPLRIRRLTATATLPRYAKPGDSGLDLAADVRVTVQIPPGERRFFRTGIAVAIPDGYEGQVRPRSGLARDHGVATFFGTVDAGYRGDVGVTLLNTGDEPFAVEPGMRIAQLVIAPVARCEVLEVDELDETERGAAGFGSTGTSGPPEAA